jgi:hypothetical protein
MQNRHNHCDVKKAGIQGKACTKQELSGSAGTPIQAGAPPLAAPSGVQEVGHGPLIPYGRLLPLRVDVEQREGGRSRRRETSRATSALPPASQKSGRWREQRAWTQWTGLPRHSQLCLRSASLRGVGRVGTHDHSLPERSEAATEF